jgi:hypothetical protein
MARGNVVEVIGLDSLGIEDVTDRMDREIEVVFLACEALFLGCRHQHPVFDERSGSVVEETGEAQYVHG